MTTHATAAQLACELDAMRRARAEDEKLCARLTARVKELEAEVASLSHARDHWMVKVQELSGIVLSDGTLGTGKLAEGTRDEKPTRWCPNCKVPVGSLAYSCVRCGAVVQEKP